MKDELMIEFYKSQTGFDAESFTKWCAWCIDHAERHGSYSEFVGRLKRCHAALQRTKLSRHGSDPFVRVGQPKTS